MTEKTPISIALIDDDRFLLQMYALKFTNEGFTTEAFSSVTEALDALRKGLVPDVIAFDITMPEHDGYFLLQTLASERLATRAFKVALTNQQSEEEKQKALELGADLYIVKATMIPSEVVNTVRTALSGHKAS